jgi:hypothetical protein
MIDPLICCIVQVVNIIVTSYVEHMKGQNVRLHQ